MCKDNLSHSTVHGSEVVPEYIYLGQTITLSMDGQEKAVSSRIQPGWAFGKLSHVFKGDIP